MRRNEYQGRHRLGTPGLAHCVQHRQVAMALEEFRRTWLTAITVPARHSLAAFRRRAAAAAREHAFAPTAAAATT